MKIAIIYDKKQPYTTGVYCKWALEEMGHDVVHYDNKERVLRKYGLVLKIDDGTDSPFKVMPWHRTAFWAIDTHTNMERLFMIAKRADLLFCAQKNGVGLFSDRGHAARWLPLAGAVEKRNKYERQLDIAFIGGVGTEKRKQLEKLLRGLTDNIYFGPAEREQIAPIYSSTFIGFNTLVGNDINMRTFEITMNGALLLMERVRDNGMEELFIENEEYIAYKDEDELTDKIKTILGNKDQYEAVRAAGHKKALERHTYKARMKVLLEGIENRSVVYDDSFFKDEWFENWEVLKTVLHELIKTDASWKSILDFGCGPAVMIDHMNDNGFMYVGCEYSEEAHSLYEKHYGKYPEQFRRNLDDCVGMAFDLFLSFDVFEHMTDDEIRAVLDKVPEIKILFLNLNRSKHIPGHINLKKDAKWIKFFRKEGYEYQKKTTEAIREKYLQLRPDGPDLWHENMFVFKKSS